MRRKQGTLLPLEADILEAGLVIGQAGFHGFQLAKHLADADGARRLTGHGTLYKALDRLADAGLLARSWEDAAAAAAAGRPRRRLYRITGAGEAALAARRSASAPARPPGRPRLEPT